MQSKLHMTPQGLLELELHDGVLVWPPNESELLQSTNLGGSPRLSSLMIRLVSAAYASLSERC